MPCVVLHLNLMPTITRHAVNENLILNFHAIMDVNGNLNKLNLWSSHAWPWKNISYMQIGFMITITKIVQSNKLIFIISYYKPWNFLDEVKNQVHIKIVCKLKWKPTSVTYQLNK